MSSKLLVLGVRKELRHAEHVFSDIAKKRKLRTSARAAINTARAKSGMREWAKDWGREKPQWTSKYYLDDPALLKIAGEYYRKLGFATRVRRGTGKAKNYFLDIYGWNSWCIETGTPKKLPNTLKGIKGAEKKKLKKVC